MKKYIFELIIHEQSDEFFEEITADGKSGCDEILAAIKRELMNYEFEIKLTGFEDK